MKMKQECIGKKDWFSVDTKYVGVLDGVRALSILIVLWFHFWQQSWLMPQYPTPFLAWLGIESIDFNIFRRCGYLFVDLLIFLSGFVLFLPQARHRLERAPLPNAKTFYLKRIARIVPCYLVAVLVMFLVSWAQGNYGNNTRFLWKDLITHLTFTHIFFPDTYQHSAINGVFWTAAVEMWFYLLFPLIGKWFRKQPILTYVGMVGTGVAFTFLYAVKQENVGFMTNQFLTFLPVFANGMLLSYFYVWYANRVRRKAVPSILATVLAVAGTIGVIWMLRDCAKAALDPNRSVQTWQIVHRYPLSLVYLVFTGGWILAVRPLRFVFSNGAMRYLSAISFNLYLWHQWLIVELRKLLGANSGSDIAAMGQNMQWILTLEALLLSLLLASVMTYAVEKPLNRQIMKLSKTERRL